MGALLNGQVWMNTGCSFCLSENGIYGNYIASRLEVRGESSTTLVAFIIHNVNGPGQYTILPQDGDVSISGVASASKVSESDFRTDANHPATVTVTYLDPINHIASGTFTFQAVNVSAPNDIMQVTSGRFDVIFSTN